MLSLNGVMSAATRSAEASNDLAMAASQIIAKRVALGLAAAFDPMQADHAEFHRMVPEKVEAFTAATRIMLERSSQAGWEITRIASDEAMTIAQATLSVAASANPMAMAGAQGQFTLAWLSRVSSNFFAMGMLALGAHEAAMVPIQRTVAANRERLVV